MLQYEQLNYVFVLAWMQFLIYINIIGSPQGYFNPSSGTYIPFLYSSTTFLVARNRENNQKVSLWKSM